MHDRSAALKHCKSIGSETDLLIAVRDPVRHPLIVVLRQQLVGQLRRLVRPRLCVGRRAPRLWTRKFALDMASNVVNVMFAMLL